MTDEPTIEATEDKAQGQFGLADLFGWLFFCGAFFAVVAAYPLVVELIQGQPIQPWRLIAPGVCWVVMLGYFVPQGQKAAVKMHVIPPALIVAAAAMVGLRPPALLIVTVSSCWASAICSFVVFLLKSLERGLPQTESPRAYLASNVIGSMLLMGLIGAKPPLNWEGVIFGVLMGFWLGLWKAVSSSDELREGTLAGLPARPVAAAGALAAFAPVVVVLSAGMRWRLLPVSPLIFGLSAALVAGLIARARKRIPPP